MVTLTNVPPAETPLRLEARKSYSLGCQFLLEDETSADLTDHVLTFVMAQPARAGGAVVLTRNFDLLDPTDGWSRMNIQGDELDLAPGQYPYSVSILTPDLYSAVVIKGEVEIVANTAPVIPGDYTGEGSAQTVQLVLQRNNRLTVRVGHLLPPRLLATVKALEYWEEPRVIVSGQYPLQVLEFELPSPGNMGGTAPNLANIPPGSVIAVVWDGDDWKIGSTVVSARPTARDDIVIHAIDGIGDAVAPPWLIAGDLFDQVIL